MAKTLKRSKPKTTPAKRSPVKRVRQPAVARDVPSTDDVTRDAQPGVLPEGIMVVGVGASAGGLEAFIEMLEAAPANAGLTFVFVQHLSPHHDSDLARLLATHTQMP